VMDVECLYGQRGQRWAQRDQQMEQYARIQTAAVGDRQPPARCGSGQLFQKQAVEGGLRHPRHARGRLFLTKAHKPLVAVFHEYIQRQGAQGFETVVQGFAEIISHFVQVAVGTAQGFWHNAFNQAQFQ